MTRALLVRLSAMGDVVQSLGAVQALQAARPDLEPCLVTQQAYAPLLQGLPGLHVVAHDRRGGLRAWCATRRRLRAWRPAVAIDLQGNWKSAAMVRMSGARERIGAAAPWRQEPRSAWLLDRTLAVAGPRHPALVAVTLLRSLAPSLAAAPPRLVASEAEVAAATAAVRAAGLVVDLPFTVIVCGDPRDPRSLRPERLARMASGRHPAVLLLAGPAEHQVPLPPGFASWRHGAGDLRLLVGLGVLVARAGGEVVGPDQGATHVLAACGARTTVLFGPQDPMCTAPPGARVLRHPLPPTCAPCRTRTCRHPHGPVCMDFGDEDGVPVALPGWLFPGEPRGDRALRRDH